MDQNVLKQYVVFCRAVRDYLTRRPDQRQGRLMFLFQWLLARGVVGSVAVAKIAQDFGPFQPDVD